MIRRPPRSTLSSSSAASDVYKRQRMPVRKHAHIFEIGEVVADGRGRHTEREVFAEVLRADGRARGDVVLDDDPQHPLLPWCERQIQPLKRQSRNRRTQTAPATYRPFRVTWIVPLRRETIPAPASWPAASASRMATTSESGTRSPQRAASSRRSRARVAAPRSSTSRGGLAPAASADAQAAGASPPREVED